MHEKLFENILKMNPYFNQKRELVFTKNEHFYQIRVKSTPWGSLRFRIQHIPQKCALLQLFVNV